MKLKLLTLLICFLTISSYGQLSKIHYIPPFFTLADIQLNQHKLFLSTPSEKPIYVKIYEGVNTFVDSVKVSKEKGTIYDLGNFPNSKGVFYYLKDLNKRLNKGGLKLVCEEAFYANIRNLSQAQGMSLSAKGVAGLGKEFRIGHMLVGYRKDVTLFTPSNFISVMATKNNTKVTISDIKEGVNFYGLKKKKGDPKTTGDHTFTLNKGQSYIIAERAAEDTPKGGENDAFGTKITSTKPIAVNCGSTVGVNPLSIPGWDNGIDQIVPINSIGNEYILVRGAGMDEMESPIVVAAFDSTYISINGDEENIIELNAGEYHIIDGSNYTRKNNMHIKAEKDFYVYQGTAGSLEPMTGGLNFVPPLSNCQNFTEVLVSDIGFLGAYVLLSIVTEVGANVKIIDTDTKEVIKEYNSTKSNLAKELDINWVSHSFNIPLDVNNILIKSDRIINVAMNYNSNAIGAASYFSGFIPEPYLIPRGGQVSYYANHYVDLDIGNFEIYDEFKWHKDGEYLTTTKSPTFHATEAGTYFVTCVSTTCGTEFNTESFTINVPTPKVLAKVEKEEIFEEPETALEAAIKSKTKEKSEEAPKVLIDINYKYNSEEIVQASVPVLNEIVATLKKYDKIKVEIRAHTDCRGNDAYNMTLSKKRANYVKNYMIKKGIDAARLTANGFGESEPLPLTKCDCGVKGACSEQHHLMNRRSEFVILK